MSEAFVDELDGLPLKERQRRTLQRMLDRDGVTEAEIRETIKRFQSEDKIVQSRKGKDPVSSGSSSEPSGVASGPERVKLALPSKPKVEEPAENKESQQLEDEEDDGQFDDDDQFDEEDDDEEDEDEEQN